MLSLRSEYPCPISPRLMDPCALSHDWSYLLCSPTSLKCEVSSHTNFPNRCTTKDPMATALVVLTAPLLRTQSGISFFHIMHAVPPTGGLVSHILYSALLLSS